MSKLTDAQQDALDRLRKKLSKDHLLLSVHRTDALGRLLVSWGPTRREERAISRTGIVERV